MTSSSGRHYSPDPACIPWGFASAGVGVASLILLLCTGSCYLIDPAERMLCHENSYFGWRRRRVVFAADEILCVTSEAKYQIGANFN